MRESVLRPDPGVFYKRMKLRRLVCLLAALLAIVLPIVLVALRTEENHYMMLFGCILADSLLGCFLICYISEKVMPGEKLYRLTRRRAQTLTGTVSDVSPKTIRYMDMDCYAISLDERKIFLPAETIQILPGEKVVFTVVSGVITEVEYAEDPYAV